MDPRNKAFNTAPDRAVYDGDQVDRLHTMSLVGPVWQAREESNYERSHPADFASSVTGKRVQF
jgi:hypothetical protein